MSEIWQLASSTDGKTSWTSPNLLGSEILDEISLFALRTWKNFKQIGLWPDLGNGGGEGSTEAIWINWETYSEVYY